MTSFARPPEEPRCEPVQASGRKRFARAADLEGVIADGIRPVYQPIVDLQSATVVGYEALARGPGGTPLEFPDALFIAARQRSLLAELDRACLIGAWNGAETAGLCAPMALFVNVEPEVIDAHVRQGGLDELRSDRSLTVFFEVTERALVARPAELLATVRRLREAGFGIALDDLGADPSSLALLPLLRPDIAKLDGSLIRARPSRVSAEILNGVRAYAESTGAAVLAEGVETADHVLAAHGMGASLAQGWYFGSPGPLPNRPRSTAGTSIALSRWPRTSTAHPAALVLEQRTPRIGSKEMLLSFSRSLEAQALDLGEHAVVAAAFQHARFFGEESRRRYQAIGASASLTVALGEAFDEVGCQGVLTGSLAPGDPLRKEWDVAVIGPHFAGALVARDLGDDGEDMRRRFEFVLTFERELVIDIAAALISRLSRA